MLSILVVFRQNLWRHKLPQQFPPRDFFLLFFSTNHFTSPLRFSYELFSFFTAVVISRAFLAFNTIPWFSPFFWPNSNNNPRHSHIGHSARSGSKPLETNKYSLELISNCSIFISFNFRLIYRLAIIVSIVGGRD